MRWLAPPARHWSSLDNRDRRSVVALAQSGLPYAEGVCRYCGVVSFAAALTRAVRLAAQDIEDDLSRIKMPAYAGHAAALEGDAVQYVLHTARQMLPTADYRAFELESMALAVDEPRCGQGARPAG